MKTVYHKYCDPSHGWLKVSVAEVIDLGIADQVSGCSFIRGNMAYLEEDDDYSLFATAKARRKEDFSYHVHHTDKQSKLRGYASFRATMEHRLATFEKDAQLAKDAKHADSVIPATSLSAAHAMVDAIGEAIHELGQIPNGHLWAVLQASIDFSDYQAAIRILKSRGDVSENGYLLKWIGAPKEIVA